MRYLAEALIIITLLLLATLFVLTNHPVWAVIFFLATEVVDLE